MNIANRITIIRIFFIPIFLFILLSGRINNALPLAALVFLLASLTDMLDGYLARSRGEITSLGKFLDPFADKLLVASALIALVQLGRLPAWIAIVIISREFLVDCLRMLAAVEGRVVAASDLGKVKTIIQISAVIGLLIYDYPLLNYVIPFSVAPTVSLILVYMALVSTVYSGVDYLLKCRGMFRKS
ncbi:MAG: CDP-diacylglycerol--glycerol-3-phosphate 3-phosphatidyltransferase [Clostridiales bacterium]|jgi:CDP-diacylglycerol--glycerol-3-phosphate 3-phosphatidyltransferase|nr:CDP-diacylglycerol--glycerol-3-phosphate 3-phosphatidyltransferase [Clostridiales bacterium]